MRNVRGLRAQWNETEASPGKLADFLRIRYGGTNDAKRMLGSIPEIRNAFVDVQGHLFR